MDAPILQDLFAALEAEEAFQRTEHQRLLKLDAADQIAAGLSWGVLRVLQITPWGRRSVLRLHSAQLLHDGIGSGDLVEVGGVNGICLGVDRTIAEVRVEEATEAEQVLVRRRFDPVTFRRYREGLARVLELDTPLIRALLGDPSEHRAPVSFRIDRLNRSQNGAVAQALGSPDIALIHGPPGTGKTEVVVALLRQCVDDGDRPWALADSNAAVDHLATRAARQGLDVVRLGQPFRMSSEAAELSLTARMARGPLAKAMANLDRELSNATGGARYALYQERDALWRQAREAALSGADVICSTLGTLAHMASILPKPRTAVVDEATQAIEPAVWGAVPWVERLVLVGDPNQLGPVVKQPGNALERSLFQRLLEELTLPMPMLGTQHRMHAGIMGLVEDVYGPGLRAHPSVAEHLLHELDGVAETDLTTRAALWVDTAGAGLEEARDPVTRSLYNEGEIGIVRTAVEELLAAGVAASDIGVITPYAAQVQRIGQAIPGVEVATVNAFQGREKEAIVCSFVRSNPDGELGFVADGRRLTVALTRARRFLLCTGDSATLARHPRFADLLDRIELDTVWSPPWS